MPRRFWLVALIALVSVVPCAGAASPAAPPQAVTARVEKMTLPVQQAAPPTAFSYLKVNPALSGKQTYTTEAVILENEHVRAVVLPEFGARLARVTFKTPGGDRDLLWVHNVLEDRLPWAMGGSRFSFPYYENGRHMDEAAGWRIVKHFDGSATVAMDMRFTPYAGETERYGRFSALRQATFVTLRPGSNVVEYTARIDNRLPVQHGFRLWNVAHFPRQAGAQVLFPTGSVTDRGAPAMRGWPTWDETDHRVLGNWGASAFAVDPQGDWSGIYYPDADANHLIVKPRYTAPGTRLNVAALKDGAADGGGDEMIEFWGGSNPVFGHPGNWLPPFGTYVMPLRLTMVTGIGRIDWANDSVAVAYEKREGGGQVRIVGFETRPGCHLMARTKQETVKGQGAIGPGRPLVLDLTKPADSVLVTVVDADDNELAEVTLPWKPEPTDPEALKALADRLRPWTPLAMELSDWTHDESPNIAEAAKALAQGATFDRPQPLLQAARTVMRTEVPRSARWAAVRMQLEILANRKAAPRYAQLYLGMMLVMEANGKVTADAARRFTEAKKLPPARYFLALEAIAGDKAATAPALLSQSVGEAPPVVMGMGEDELPGADRLHPAATMGGQWPTLVEAAVLTGLDQPQRAIALLNRLLTLDPARPEALALLADALAKAEQPGKAQEARAEAERFWQRNPEARRDYEALLREAKTGAWAGIPRP